MTKYKKVSSDADVSESSRNQSENASFSVHSPPPSSSPSSSASSSTYSASIGRTRLPQLVDLLVIDQKFAAVQDIISRNTSSRLTATSPPNSTKIPATKLRQNEKVTSDSSTFLKRIPLELRRMIYSYLLTNPLLAEPVAIESRFASGATQKYKLFPAILRTCKQVYEESSQVLYENNTIIISCIGKGYEWGGDAASESRSPRVLECPLTRYEGSSHMELAEFGAKSQFRKVKHWKILVSLSAERYRNSSPPTGLLDFCLLLFSSRPKSVTAMSVGKKFTRDWRGFRDFDRVRVRDIRFPASIVLAPLKVLRNLQELKFEAFETAEVAYGDQMEVKVIAESDDPSPLLMYPSLLAYAQSFERSQKFKTSMGKVRWYSRADMALMPPPNKLLRPKWQDRKYVNPFKTSETHPVEHSLELAKFACDENDLAEFKLQRKLILEYLEPQYQRIADFMDQLRAFINKQKGEVDGKPGILREDAIFQDDEFADVGEQIEDLVEGTLLLEDCGKAFVRDLSPRVRRFVRLYQQRFDSECSSSVRDSIVNGGLNKLLLCADWKEWCNDFKRAAKDMMKQYLTIRHARKKLFEGDAPDQDRGCNISLETWRCDKKLDGSRRGMKCQAAPVRMRVSLTTRMMNGWTRCGAIVARPRSFNKYH